MIRKFPNFELPEVKRFYLNGVVLKEPCPQCGKELTWDGGFDYLMEPCNSEIHTFTFACSDCNLDFELDYKFQFDLTVTPCTKD